MGRSGERGWVLFVEERKRLHRTAPHRTNGPPDERVVIKHGLCVAGSREMGRSGQVSSAAPLGERERERQRE